MMHIFLIFLSGSENVEQKKPILRQTKVLKSMHLSQQTEMLVQVPPQANKVWANQIITPFLKNNYSTLSQTN